MGAGEEFCPGSVEGFPKTGIVDRRQSHLLTAIETGEGRIDKLLCAHEDRRIEIGNWYAGCVIELGDGLGRKDDRRIKRARLTASGLARTQQMYALWRDANRRIEAVLGDGRTEQLRELANQVASSDFRAAFEDSN